MRVLIVLLLVGLASCSSDFSNGHGDSYPGDHGQGSEESSVSFESSGVALADGDHHSIAVPHISTPEGYMPAPKGFKMPHGSPTTAPDTIHVKCVTFIPKDKNLKITKKCTKTRTIHNGKKPATGASKMPASSSEEINF